MRKNIFVNKILYIMVVDHRRRCVQLHLGGLL